MKTITFGRILNNGFKNFWRNIWLSLAAILVLTVTLVILQVLTGLFIVTDFAVTSIKDRVDVSVYMNRDVSEKDILQVRDQLILDPRVAAVNYVSAASALETFKNRHENNKDLYASLSELEENPLSAVLQVKAKLLESYPELIKSLQEGPAKEKIAKINYEDNSAIIDRLQMLLAFLIKAGSILALVFAGIAVLVIFNTITLTIFNRREEVEIMRLVGATNWYIRGPFLVESCLYTAVAVAIAMSLWLPIYFNILPAVSAFIGNPDQLVNEFILTPLGMLVGLIVVSLLLSVLSSALAMRRSLRI